MAVNSRRDSRLIHEADEANLLSSCGLSAADMLASGTEAHVYALDANRLLKIYAGAEQLKALENLRKFYASIDRPRLAVTLPHIALPYIEEITLAGTVVGVIETRLPGVPMEQFVEARPAEIERIYIEVTLSLQAIHLAAPITGFRLFPDPARDPDLARDETSATDWTQFVSAMTTDHLKRVSSLLSKDVVNFEMKVTRLLSMFSSAYEGKLALVHGDLCPANILMSGGRVSAILDFGTFTMYGDPLFDLGTACGYFAMYSIDRREIRARLFEIAATYVEPEEISRAISYLLVAAFVTCDLYPEADLPVRQTGHYRWAIDVLNDPHLWTKI